MLKRYVGAKFPTFFGKLDGLLESQYWSQKALQALQDEKLRKLIRFAYEEVPYYRETFEARRLTPEDFRGVDDLQRLPVLNKRDLRDVTKLTARRAPRSTFYRRTSGSTGTPFKVLVDREASISEMALVYRFLLSIGYDWGDEIVQLWGAPVVGSGSIVPRIAEGMRQAVRRAVWNLNNFDTYKSDTGATRKIAATLTPGRPRVLRGYTSAIYSLALEIIQRDMRVGAKAVITTAEKLFGYQRKTIERAFGPILYDQYGCGESNSIAFECEQHHGLHVASEHVAVELLDADGGSATTGRVVFTDLDNYAMPLIRYENGDLATWANGACACGRGSPMIKQVDGRQYELLEVPGGRKIHGGFFDEIYIEMGFGDRYLIEDLRVVQEAIDRYRLEFVMSGQLSHSDVAALRAKYAQYLGDVRVDVVYVDAIPSSESGKRLFVLPLGKATNNGERERRVDATFSS